MSLSLTYRHIWCVDKSDRLHYSGLSGPGLKWRKVDEHAKHISVSRYGAFPVLNILLCTTTEKMGSCLLLKIPLNQNLEIAENTSFGDGNFTTLLSLQAL